MPEELETETQDQEQEKAAPAENAETTQEDESGDEAEQNSEESAASEGEQPGTGQQPPRKGGFQRKLDKKVRENSQLASERDYWRDKALSDRKTEEKSAPEQKAEATTEKSEPEPKLADFENWDDYFAAQRKWMLKEAERIAETKVSAVEKRRTDETEKRSKEAELKALDQRLEEREERAKKKYADWADVAGSGKGEDVQLPVLEELASLNKEYPAGVGAIAEILQNDDPDGDLEYYLASNLPEVERIAKLSRSQASLELGKLLGTKLAPQESSATKANAAAAASKALPPPKTLSKTTPTVTGVDADMAKNNPDEYFRRREAQIIEQQRKGRKR